MCRLDRLQSVVALIKYYQRSRRSLKYSCLCPYDTGSCPKFKFRPLPTTTEPFWAVVVFSRPHDRPEVLWKTDFHPMPKHWKPPVVKCSHTSNQTQKQHVTRALVWLLP